jgi:hypothetical protein
MGLRVELDPVTGTFPVAEAHDLAVVLGGGRHPEVRRQGAGLHHQAVVPHGRESLGQAEEELLPVVQDAGRLAVPHPRGRGDACPGEEPQALVAQADAEDGRVREGVEHGGADPEVGCMVRTAGPRGDEDIVEPLRPELLQGALVVAEEQGLLAVHFPEVLVKDVAEGVVVVEEEGSHGEDGRRARSHGLRERGDRAG